MSNPNIDKLNPKSWEERLEDFFPHSLECGRATRDMRKFGLVHPRNCVEPDRMDKIDKFKAFINQLLLDQREENGSTLQGYKNVRSWFDRFNYPYAPTGKSCPVCGGKLTTIRGRYPGEPARLACATCAVEIIESIVDNLRSLIEGPSQALSKEGGDNAS